MKIKSKILEIQFLAMQCTELGQDCFTQYSAHVNMFSIDLHDGKWSFQSKPIAQEFSVDDSKKSLEKADRILYQLRRVVRKKGIDLERLIQIEEVSFKYRF
jgi:hypothetical protein